MSTLTIVNHHNTAYQGKQYNNLSDYLDDIHNTQKNCAHTNTIIRKPHNYTHVYIITECVECGYILSTNIVPFEEG